jgi:beta-phosphoglucomutase
MIKAVIFDLDGVLVDATEWHYEALNKALNYFGYIISRTEHLEIYNGLPTDEKLKILSERKALPQILHKEIKFLKNQYTFETVKEKCIPDEGKYLLLSYLKSQGYLLACCSNAQQNFVEMTLKLSKIDHFFSYIIGTNGNFKPKPAPDIYLNTFKEIDVLPHEVIIFEDSPHGIKAAEASGARVVMVPNFSALDLSFIKHVNL